MGRSSSLPDERGRAAAEARNSGRESASFLTYRLYRGIARLARSRGVSVRGAARRGLQPGARRDVLGFGAPAGRALISCAYVVPISR
jgi:hypothetical protein